MYTIIVMAAKQLSNVTLILAKSRFWLYLNQEP